MAPIYIKLIEISVLVGIFLALRLIIGRLIGRTIKKQLIAESRGRLMRRTVFALLAALLILLVLTILGIDQSDLFVFVGSLLTVVGVAFFAQWSLLSNVTSSIIIFFNHPLRLNDTVQILEGKDYTIEGEIVTIGLFFISLETREKEIITIPNNVFIQKSIRKVGLIETDEEAE